MLNTEFPRLECAYSIFILVDKRLFILCACCDVEMGEAFYRTGPAICEDQTLCLILDSPFSASPGQVIRPMFTCLLLIWSLALCSTHICL